jgi:Zn-dependent peptidase ImmA (M78 family)
MTVMRPIHAANHVLDALRITAIEDLHYLEQIAWERGALVRPSYLKGMEARLTFVREQAIITVSTEVRNAHRRRFSIAHELGHLEMHRWEDNVAICLSTDIDIIPFRAQSSSKEREANLFASALLLPERFFAPMCDCADPSLDEIARLARRFNTSLTATAIRYADYTEEPIAIVLSKNGKSIWFKESNYFKQMELFVEINCRLDPSTKAAQLFKGRTVSPRSAPVLASSWLTSGNYRANAKIMEQSRLLTSELVLTLIWIHDDIEVDDY